LGFTGAGALGAATSAVGDEAANTGVAALTVWGALSVGLTAETDFLADGCVAAGDFDELLMLG